MHPAHIDDPSHSFGLENADTVLARMRPGDRLEHRLAEVGLEIADITHVVNTHLHPDHCGGNFLFPHAKSSSNASTTRRLSRTPRSPTSSSTGRNSTTGSSTATSSCSAASARSSRQATRAGCRRYSSRCHTQEHPDHRRRDRHRRASRTPPLDPLPRPRDGTGKRATATADRRTRGRTPPLRTRRRPVADAPMAQQPCFRRSRFAVVVMFCHWNLTTD
jgi:ribonuclease BN (tRNA processing enzyme)